MTKRIVRDKASAWLASQNVAVKTSRGSATGGPSKTELLKRHILKTVSETGAPPTRESCMIALYGKDTNSWKPESFKNYCTYLRKGGQGNYTKKKYKIDLINIKEIVYVIGYPNADETDLMTDAEHALSEANN
jgi:hypothetical protein